MALHLMLAALLLQPAAATPVSSPLVTSAERQSAIVAAEAAFTDATRSKDEAALKTILASDFGLTAADMPDPLPAATWLANLKRMTLHSYVTRVVDVRSYGDLAIATVEGEWEVQLGDEPRRKDKFLLADFWSQRDGRWQISRRHIIGH